MSKNTVMPGGYNYELAKYLASSYKRNRNIFSDSIAYKPLMTDCASAIPFSVSMLVESNDTPRNQSASLHYAKRVCASAQQYAFVLYTANDHVQFIDQS